MKASMWEAITSIRCTFLWPSIDSFLSSWHSFLLVIIREFKVLHHRVTVKLHLKPRSVE